MACGLTPTRPPPPPPPPHDRTFLACVFSSYHGHLGLSASTSARGYPARSSRMSQRPRLTSMTGWPKRKRDACTGAQTRRPQSQAAMRRPPHRHLLLHSIQSSCGASYSLPVQPSPGTLQELSWCTVYGAAVPAELSVASSGSKPSVTSKQAPSTCMPASSRAPRESENERRTKPGSEPT
jgi:hypothetical protein